MPLCRPELGRLDVTDANEDHLTLQKSLEEGSKENCKDTFADNKVLLSVECNGNRSLCSKQHLGDITSGKANAKVG